MSREKIAVDMDDVLFPFVPNIAIQHNEIHGTKLTESDFHSFSFKEVWGGTLEEARAEVMSFLNRDHTPIMPIEGAQDITRSLSKQYRLSLVTARDSSLEYETVRWIEQYFPGIFSDVILTGNPYVSESYERKVDICKRLGAFMLVDDSVSHTTECVDAGLDAVLFGDYQWNQTKSELPTGITRVPDWQAIAEHLGVEG